MLPFIHPAAKALARIVGHAIPSSQEGQLSIGQQRTSPDNASTPCPFLPTYEQVLLRALSTSFRASSISIAVHTTPLQHSSRCARSSVCNLRLPTFLCLHMAWIVAGTPAESINPVSPCYAFREAWRAKCLSRRASGGDKHAARLPMQAVERAIRPVIVRCSVVQPGALEEFRVLSRQSSFEATSRVRFYFPDHLVAFVYTL